MFLAKTQIDGGALADNHCNDQVDEQGNCDENINRGMMPRELAFQPVDGECIALNTAVR